MQKYFYAFSVALALAGGVASRAAMQSDVRSVTPMERDYSRLTPVKGEQYLGRINFNAKDRTTVVAFHRRHRPNITLHGSPGSHASR